MKEFEYYVIQNRAYTLNSDNLKLSFEAIDHMLNKMTEQIASLQDENKSLRSELGNIKSAHYTNGTYNVKGIR